jgi:hypothetical protein
MNRAMGFGVLTGTMLGTTTLTAPPASAHDIHLETRGYGGVSIINDHTELRVFDSFCDGVIVQGSMKSTGSPSFLSLSAPCEGVDSMDVPAGAYAFRKCLSGGGMTGCSAWQPID